MTHRSRLIAAAVALSAAFVAPLVIAAPAAALTAGDDVLFYSNGSFTDQSEEDPNMIASLQASGATVTSFDGGDGTLVTWTAALTSSVDAFVIPENGGVWASLLPEVQDLITQWIEDGGILILGNFFSEAQTVSDVTGLDYQSVWAGGSCCGPYTLQGTNPALLPEVGYANGTNVIDTSGWGADLLAIFTPIYANGTSVAVGGWSVGSGFIFGFGWDWYPDSGELANGIPTPWNTALLTLASGPEPEPELAATGGQILPLGAAAAALLLLVGAVGIAMRRRVSTTD